MNMEWNALYKEREAAGILVYKYIHYSFHIQLLSEYVQELLKMFFGKKVFGGPAQ